MKSKYLFAAIPTATVLFFSLSAQAQTQVQGTQYPPKVEVTRIALPDTFDRPCTQLELHAGIPTDMCGKMPLAEVVNYMWPSVAD